MDAMILAAGLGTRLQPLTLETPKALVDVGGVPMLGHVARRLVAAGADRIIINTAGFHERIVEFVRAGSGFGADVLFSHEPDGPYDTGGGLRHARHLFRAGAPFLLHNVDVLSDIDLAALYAAHVSHESALVTLAVVAAEDERYLIFDGDGLCGYAPRSGGADVFVRRSVGEPQRFGFAGIHAASPDLLTMLPVERNFSIMSLYLRLARQGHRIAASPALDAKWVDIGTHEALARARLLFD